MIYSEDTVTITTVGRCFWHDTSRAGIWAAQMLWVDDDETRPIMERLKGTAQGVDHVNLEVKAVLEGLRRGVEIGKSIEVHAVNQSVVDTIGKYIDSWKKNGWRRAGRKPISCLKQWQEIDAICQTHPVSWAKRQPTEIDTIKDYEDLWRALEERDNELWMRRALERDPC